jgi:hypothetical protein
VQLVATTRDNVSPSFVLEFLKRIGAIIKVGGGDQAPYFHRRGDHSSSSSSSSSSIGPGGRGEMGSQQSPLGLAAEASDVVGSAVKLSMGGAAGAAGRRG